ncbi:MAG: zinc ribbon domain-containing protein [Acidobacteria bacterium]|nr:zinc ribbon domain-containing protein [Acidobacteriota bacterium]
MPIYEFECLDCGRKTTALVLSRERIGDVRCRKCGSGRLEKLFSRFASPKSEEARLDALSDPSSFGDLDENDPASMARWMKKMGKEMGEDFGDDLDEAVEEELASGSGAAPPGESGGGDDS